MALALQEGGIAAGDWRWWLSHVLEDVDCTIEDEVVVHMLAAGILAEHAGVLGLGPEGQRQFGRRHFQELVAAFTTPLLLAVRHGSTDLGTIDPLSISRERTSVPVILLGGRTWRVLDIDWPRRVASVEPTAEAGRSRWFGSARALPAEVARAVEQVLVTGSSGVTLSRRASAALDGLREAMPFLDGKSLSVVATGDEVRISTFAGGRANAMLSGGLFSQGLRVRTTDNFSIGLIGTDTHEVTRVLAAVEPASLAVATPDRLSNELKYRACLPDELARAVLAARLAEPDAVERLLRRPRRVFRTGG